MLFKKTILLCKRTILVNTITLFLVFLLLGLLAAERSTNSYYLNNTDLLEKEFYFIPDDSASSDVAESSKALADFDGKTVEGWYVNQMYYDNFIQLERGKDLNYGNSSEVLLCGESLQNSYNINDEVCINGKMYRIAGFVNSDIGLIDLSWKYDQDNPVTWINNLVNIKTSELFITNDINFSQNAMPGISVISTSDVDNTGISFQKICENTRKDIRKKTYFNRTLTIVLFLFSLFCILSNKITEIVVLGDYYSIYKLCELTKAKEIIFSLLINIIYISLALTMHIFVFTSSIRYNISVYNIESTVYPCLYLSIFVIIISILFDMRKKERREEV